MINLNNQYALVNKDNWHLQCLIHTDICSCFPDKEVLNKCKFIKCIPYVSIAVRCAELVLPIYEQKYPKDKRVRDCIVAIKQYLVSKISKEQLLAAYAAANAAAYAAAYAAYVAYVAANAATNAAYVAYVAANAATNAAANVAAFAELSEIKKLQAFLESVK